MTMFQMIDELEPIIPEREMNMYHADMCRHWRLENPEAFKRLFQKYNKRRTRRKEENDERLVVDRR